MTDKAKEVINKLNLSPLKGEGGFFRSLHEFGDSAGCIYYLVTDESFSHLHALTDDELWFFLEGDQAEQVIINEKGEIEKRVLDSNNRESLVLKNYFQSTFIKSSNLGYSLFSTIMSPKYRDEMYISGKKDEIVGKIEEIKDLL